MKRPLIIGVMGGGQAEPQDLENAFRLGGLIAENGWYLLNGGRPAGIMEASARGAAEKKGLTIGILPGDNAGQASVHIAIPIVTGLGNARNCINVLSSDVVVACPGGAGTLSEIALALKNNKPVITLGFRLDGLNGIAIRTNRLFAAQAPEEAIAIVKGLFPN